MIHINSLSLDVRSRSEILDRERTPLITLIKEILLTINSILIQYELNIEQFDSVDQCD